MPANWTSTPIQIPDQALLSAADVGVYLGVHQKTVLRWVREGRFPAPRKTAGGSDRWTARAVGVWLAWQDFAPEGPLVAGPGGGEPPAGPPAGPPAEGKKPGTQREH